MKRLILITTLATFACLFVAGQALSAGKQSMGPSDAGQSAGVMNQGQQQGMMNQGQRQGMMNQGQRQGMMGRNLNREQIREAQRLLNRRGFKAGMEDGIYGRRCRTAILAFQKSEKLAFTGMLDGPTLRALAPTTAKQQYFGLSPTNLAPASRTMEKLP